jgi:site-specific DNA recombinase
MDHRNGTNGRVNAVVYARVSSKEQEREGFSIPAQLDLLRKYAHDAGMVVLQEFVDVESASVTGRSGFGEMLAFLKKNRSKCQTILVEKTDRLYRNLKDYVTMDEARVTVHFVKENNVLSPDARSSDQFIHGIKVLMARNYSQNLGEETRKGMLQKARAGLYPSYAPLGYRNFEGPDGKRIIVPDTDAPAITRLFGEFATGAYSLKALAEKARKETLMLRGRPVYKSELHQILRKRVYTGDFDWDGNTYQGTHEPIVTREVWEKVQGVLNQRAETKQHRIKHDFAFTGFITCGHCGCQLVGELKKGRYVYYHCTGHRGKCPERYTREEIMAEQLASSLRDLVIPREVLAWLTEAVSASDMNEQAAREKTVRKLEEQHRRAQAKLEAMYEDKLEGRISAEFYDRKAKDLQAQASELLRKVNQIRVATPAPVNDAINLMDLTSRAAELFMAQQAHEQQRFLRLVLRSASWQAGELRTEFEEPFETLRRSNRLILTKHKEKRMGTPEIENWLPGMDSNHDSRLQRPLSYR